MSESAVPRRWASNKEAAAYIGCSENFLDKDRLTRLHCIPFYRLGRHIRYDLNDLDDILAQSKMATAPKKEKKPVELELGSLHECDENEEFFKELYGLVEKEIPKRGKKRGHQKKAEVTAEPAATVC